MTDSSNAVREAYSATGSNWGEGPARLYGRLAEWMLDQSPASFEGRTVLDVGAGSGAVSQGLAARGARPMQADFAIGMLTANRATCVPQTNGDVMRLPFRSRAFGGTAAGFCLNHLDEPAIGLRELVRVVEPGGVVLVSTFGEQAPHPAKAAVDAVATAHGFEVPPWYAAMKGTIEHLLSTTEAMVAVAEQARVEDPIIVDECVDCGIDTPEAMASYRLGMAHLAPFVSGLPPDEQQALRDETEAALEGLPPFVPRVIALAAIV